MAGEAERRSHERLQVERPAKIYLRAARSYIPARTTNVSFGGALLDLHTERPIAPGDRIDVAVAWSPEPLVSAGSMIESKVIRATPASSGHQLVAVCFVQAAAAAKAA